MSLLLTPFIFHFHLAGAVWQTSNKVKVVAKLRATDGRSIPVRSQAFGPRRLTAHSAAGEAMAAAMRSAHAAIWSGSSGPETFTALAALLNWRVLLSMAPRISVMLARMSSSWEELGPATFA